MTASPTTLGPVQVLVVGFDQPFGDGQVLVEFARLRESDAVRLLDLLVVHKDAEGTIERVDHGEAVGDGVLVERLVGLGPAGGPVSEPDARLADSDVWSLDDAIPNDSFAVIVLVEHRWAIGTRDMIRAAGGSAIADAWVHPADLAAAGVGDVRAD